MCKVRAYYSSLLLIVFQIFISFSLSVGKINALFESVSRLPSMPDREYRKLVVNTAMSGLRKEQAIEQAAGRCGIRTLIDRGYSCDRGHFFELVGILHAKFGLGQKIEGAGLEVVLESPTKTDIHFRGDLYELHSAEFDVVSQDFVIECKCSLRPDKNVKMSQLVKEVAMIGWLGQIRDEWCGKDFIKRILFEHGKKKLFIQGICTLGREVCLSSNWINIWECDQASLDHWFKLISNLAQKKVIVFYENEISQETIEALDEEGIEYEQNIDISLDLLINQRRTMLKELNDRLKDDLDVYACSAETHRAEPVYKKYQWLNYFIFGQKYCASMA